MFNAFNKVLDDYRRTLLSTFWFVPGLVSLLGPLLTFFFLNLDHRLTSIQALFVFSGGIVEVNTILSTMINYCSLEILEATRRSPCREQSDQWKEYEAQGCIECQVCRFRRVCLVEVAAVGEAELVDRVAELAKSLI